MYDLIEAIPKQLKWLMFCILSLALLYVFVVLLFPRQVINAQTGESSKRYVSHSDNPNIISQGFIEAGYEIGYTVSDITNSFKSATEGLANASSESADGVGSAIGQASSSTGRFAVTTGKLAAGAVAATGSTMVGAAVFVLELPINTVSAASNTSIVSSLINTDNSEQLPTIDPDGLFAADQKQLDQANTSSVAPAGGQSLWPMHGQVTTRFGVPHWPYQPTHTGIDISDGRASGVTPIKPFKNGTIISIVNSRRGLGNHIVIDHGGGVTSVYAHLSSIAVQTGQAVNTDTVLGQAGSTGASTGTHLHFEIRINNKPVNPTEHIAGQP